ncbi:hypothetical protein CPB83DRAFT_909258 [Crepidotus variabilis]|uniref:MYND-type domain-containing protein n=1 Tax=Crepidotus variabilis TaxID=179855 RepID=A0A9P6EAA9_9AGAR|nr:hypothetical protein CPB83DRAFT_909258 [Crepidotus variabilis]
MADLSLANTCDNCDKHLPPIHGIGKEPVCERCLLVTTLLTCGGCHEVRYCCKACQRAHWKDHKGQCAENLRVVKLSQSYGPLVAAQRKSILRWSKKTRLIFHVAATFAMGAGTNQDKSQSHCFLLTVKAGSSGDLPSITAISAQVASDKELQALGVPPNSKILHKQSNSVKFIIFDPALPEGLGLIHMFLEDVDTHASRELVGSGNFNWNAWLMDSLSDGGEARPIADFVDFDFVTRTRRAALETWCRQFGEEYGMAAYSAMNLRTNTKKMTTHLLRVYVDGNGGSPPRFKVRSADVVTFEEMKFPRTLKKTIYTLIVDDSLPELISTFPIGLDVQNFTLKGLYHYRHDWLQKLKQDVDQY